MTDCTQLASASSTARWYSASSVAILGSPLTTAAGPAAAPDPAEPSAGELGMMG